MRLNSLVLPAALLALLLPAPAATAQISFGVNIGPEPACPYGYYDYAPYNCAPYGYYGPEWFNGDSFMGAGPWFHGPHDFYGHIDNRFDPRRGYRGPFPQRGDQRFNHFHGNAMRDGRGHERAMGRGGYRGGGRGGDQGHPH